MRQGGSELQANGEASGTRQVRDIALPVHGDRTAVEFAVRAPVHKVVAVRVVLPVEHVEDIEAGVDLRVATDVEILGELQGDIAVAPDIATEQELRTAGRRSHRDAVGTVGFNLAIAGCGVLRKRSRKSQLDRTGDAPRQVDRT